MRFWSRLECARAFRITPILQYSITPFRRCILRQFHHVIEITGLVVAADLQDINEAIVAAGDRLVFLDAFEFALERIGFAEIVTGDNLHSSQRAHDIVCQPDFAITAAANPPEQFMVRDGGRRLLRDQSARFA